MSQQIPSPDSAASEAGERTEGSSTEDPRLAPSPEPTPSSRRVPAEIRIKINPKRILIGASALVIVIGGTVAGLTLTAGPSYPHPWCASTLNYMYGGGTPTGTFQDFLNELQYEENQGAPTGQLLTDEESALQDTADLQSASVLNVQGDLANAVIDEQHASRDAAAINRACGEPANYDIGKLAVPAAG